MPISDLCYIDESGYHFADYPAFLAEVQQIYKDCYGSDVYIEDDSQDGQWLAVLAQMLYDTAAQGASTYSSFSPGSAQGAGLSRLVKINGLQRREATKSTVTVTVGGTDGTVIENGVVQDTLGQKWDLPAIVNIGPSGEEDVLATAQEEGALTAAIGTVNKIFTPTQGWQTVTNDVVATPGEPVEIDAELRARQAVSTANPSRTVFEGTVGAVKNTDGVTAAVGYENDSNVTDGNGIPAHSICIVVNGGTDEDVATAINNHKGPGCGTFGGESVVVYDEHGVPNTINFQRPTPAAISVKLTLSTFAGYTTDYEPLIKQAVADAINEVGIGAIDSGMEIIITRLFLSAYLPAIPSASESYDIETIEIKKNAGSFVTTNLAIDFDEQPNCDVGDISFVYV